MGKRSNSVRPVREVPARAYREKLQKWIIPELAFENAAINDVVDFLVQTSRELDAEKGIGLNTVYLGPHDPEPEIGASFFEDKPSDKQVGDEPQITRNLRRVSMWDAIRLICQVIDVPFYLDETGAVVITER